jgi:hypothetical protein
VGNPPAVFQFSGQEVQNSVTLVFVIESPRGSRNQDQKILEGHREFGVGHGGRKILISWGVGVQLSQKRVFVFCFCFC